MQNNFQAISASYKNTPLEVRERLTLDEAEAKSLMNHLKDLEDISDILVVSTCNRTEIYYASATDYTATILNELLQIKQINAPAQDFLPYFELLQIAEAVAHLFEMAIGLESQVIGDLQITSQVKQAYQWSADVGVAGPFLHRLLHTIFFTNKRVVQETVFRSGAASTSYTTVELVEDLAIYLLNPKVLVVGLGEIGQDVCRNLRESSIKDFTLINRTLDKAITFAKEVPARVLPFEQLREAVQEADIIISSVSVEKPLFDLDLLGNQEITSFKYFIDLSVPRSVSSALEGMNGYVVYNIDQINTKVNQAQQKRHAAIPAVRSIIEASLAEFYDWTREMEISPTLQRLKNALEQIRQEEVARYQKKLTEEEAARIDLITKNMMQKIIKLPALQLKAACKRGEAETLIDLLNDLFDLEKQGERVA